MSKISTRISLREIPTAELASLYPLIHIQNPQMTRAVFTARLKAMIPLGYRAVGVFLGDALIGCSGFWIRTRFWCGQQLDIDNFIVHPEYRGKKLGEKLVAWLEKKAIAEQCDLIVLDTYADSFLAQRFYHRAGFAATGYHFTKIPGSKVPYSR